MKIVIKFEKIELKQSKVCNFYSQHLFFTSFQAQRSRSRSLIALNRTHLSIVPKCIDAWNLDIPAKIDRNICFWQYFTKIKVKGQGQRLKKWHAKVLLSKIHMCTKFGLSSLSSVGNMPRTGSWQTDGRPRNTVFWLCNIVPPRVAKPNFQKMCIFYLYMYSQKRFSLHGGNDVI